MIKTQENLKELIEKHCNFIQSCDVKNKSKNDMLEAMKCLGMVALWREKILKSYDLTIDFKKTSIKCNVALEANMSYNAVEQIISGDYRNELLNNIAMNECCFANCDFEGAAITGAIFRNCYFLNVDFLDVALQHSTFENCILELKNYPFKHVGTLGIKLNNCILIDTSLQNISPYSALFHNTILYNCKIKIATFEKFVFDNCSFHNINFTRCNLHYAEVRNIKMHNCTIDANYFPWVIGGMDYIFNTNDSIDFVGHNEEKISKDNYTKYYLKDLIDELQEQSALNYKVNFALGNILSSQNDSDAADTKYNAGIHEAQSKNDYRMLNFFSKALIRRKDYTYQDKFKKLAEILDAIKSGIKNVNDYTNFANHISEIAIIHTQFSKISENITGEISFELLISLLNEIQVNFNIGTGVEYDSKNLQNLFDLIKCLYECEIELKKDGNIKVQLMLSHKSPININVILSDKSQKLKANGHKFIEKLKEKINTKIGLNYEVNISDLNSTNTLANKLMEDKKIMEKQTNIIASGNSQVVNIEGNNNSINQQLELEQNTNTNHNSNNIDWYNPQEKLTDLKEGELQSLLETTPRYFSMNFLQNIMSISKRVCKISICFNNNKTNSGTGLLINSNCLLTCNHIFKEKTNVNAKIRSVRLIFGFDEEEILKENKTQIIVIDLNKTQFIHCSYGDVCLIKNINLIEKNFTLAKINIQSRRIKVMADNSENLNVAIIHHPLGHQKVVSMAHNTIVKFDENIIQYETDTQPGSSGAPVFDHSFNLIGVHTLGKKLISKNNTYANEGVSSILINKFLNSNKVIL